MDKQTHFDFVTSIVLMLLSVALIVGSYRMGVEVGGDMYASPGMLPMVLAVLLLFTSILLFKRSIQTNGIAKNVSMFVSWFERFRQSKMCREFMVGGLILALYTFVLAPRLPFWLSTSIFMLVLMGVLKATSIVKSVMITALVVGSVYGVFQMIFHVPLP